MLKIGSHVGMAGKEMLLGAAKEAASYGANTFMIYTGAPQNTRRKPCLLYTSHFKLEVPGMVACPQCGEMKLSHRVCGTCGTYKGREVVKTEE